MKSWCWVGIDVACAKRKYLPISIVVRDGDLLVPLPLRRLEGMKPPMGMGNARVIDTSITQSFAKQAVKYVVGVANYHNLEVAGVAIDAPSNFKRNGTARRAAEVALDAAGISCFATPSHAEFEAIVAKAHRHLEDGQPLSRIPHSNQLWMLYGYALFAEFAKLAECREVYPQATVRILGVGHVHKTNEQGLMEQLMAVSKHTGWPEGSVDVSVLKNIGFAHRHDNFDAYLAAWTASLHRNRLDALGEPPDDVIFVPKVKSGHFQSIRTGKPISVTRPVNNPAKKVLSGEHARVCPACNAFEFKRWPFGWDAHAAHTCSGLIAVDPAARKAEYRERFASLFGG